MKFTGNHLELLTKAVVDKIRREEDVLWNVRQGYLSGVLVKFDYDALAVIVRKALEEA